MISNKKIVSITICALTYYLIFYINKFFFGNLEFSYGVNWVFIPSGIQLLLVLVAGIDGALGIVLASFFIGIENYFLDSLFRTFITALISGFSPLLARKISIDLLGLQKNLLNITLRLIVKMSLIFGIISASLHQLWFFYNNKNDDFLSGFFIMFVGNILGTCCILLLVTLTNTIVKLLAEWRTDE